MLLGCFFLVVGGERIRGVGYVVGGYFEGGVVYVVVREI